jgi:hypothetical protein
MGGVGPAETAALGPKTPRLKTGQVASRFHTSGSPLTNWKQFCLALGASNFTTWIIKGRTRASNRLREFFGWRVITSIQLN